MVQPADFFGDDGGGEALPAIVATGPVWLWRAADPQASASWVFLTIGGDAAEAVRAASVGRSGGFGSVKVEALIGATRWHTSLFPSKAQGGYLLPLKAAVRKAEALKPGMDATVTLTLV